MSIHILFANGSNPYLRYNMSPADFARELLQWAANYELEFIKATDSILHFRATERGTAGGPN